MEYGEQRWRTLVARVMMIERPRVLIATEGPPTYMLSFVGNDLSDLSELATSYLRK